MPDPQALHAELLAKIEELDEEMVHPGHIPADAVRAVLELHKPEVCTIFADDHRSWQCAGCEALLLSDEVLIDSAYPCSTVRVIASALGVVADG